MLRLLRVALALALLIPFGFLALAAPFWVPSILHERKANRIRPAALLVTMRNAEPLIPAIHSYTEEHGKPPPTLEALRPGYIKSTPARWPITAGIIR